MNQIVIPVPNVTPNVTTNILGVIGAIAVLLQPYLKTGTISLETIAIAVFVAVICFFVGKTDPAMEAGIVKTVSGVIDSTLATKLPALLTAAQPVNTLETALVDVAATQATSAAPE